MLDILADISAQPVLSLNLGFKGGTACYFVYGLDRFSVDLDFDLLDENMREQVLRELDIILGKYGRIKMIGGIFSRKIKYNEESSAIKIDISERTELNSLNRYEIKDIVSGVPLKTLVKEDIFAHKLIALMERYDLKKHKKIANRDLYDIEYFFRNDWKFNDKIIELRSGKSSLEYLRELKKFVETKVDEGKILDGLGALIDEQKRNWVKNNLKNEVVKRIAIQIESMK
jgi:predicted nucleotidyltransferase component of viral defense system